MLLVAESMPPTSECIPLIGQFAKRCSAVLLSVLMSNARLVFYCEFILLSTSNLTPVADVRSASSGLVLHAQHIFANSFNFSSPEGYRLQFSIPCAYFVYTVWHCGQHCSSMYACSYRLFAGTWRPFVSVITTLFCCDYFYRRVWYRALSLRYVCIRSSGIIVIP